MPQSEISSKARDHWRKGEAFEAGELIFESLPRESLPLWAGSIFRLVVNHTEIKSNPIDFLMSIVDRPERWSFGHAAFDDLRDATLELSAVKSLSPQQASLLNHLSLGEEVAKVIYNATKPRDEFDEESGLGIAVSLQEILEEVDDEGFSKTMLSALFLNEMERG